jgi:predicted lipoprotein with Yx(FWY)xxD motif
VAAVVAVAGCGSSNSTTNSTSATTTASPYARSTTSNASTTPAPAAAAVAIRTKHNKLGTILAAGAKRATVYLFEADKRAQSACSGDCTKVWPPVTVSSAPTAAGGAVSADLGTITRTDGTKQVTYKGHPLYFYARDEDDEDAYGQGLKSFGAEWYVLAPSGKKVEGDES